MIISVVATAVHISAVRCKMAKDPAGKVKYCDKEGKHKYLKVFPHTMIEDALFMRSQNKPGALQALNSHRRHQPPREVLGHAPLEKSFC